MSEKAEEQISALMDGELPDAEQRQVIGRLAGDRRLAERWARYHLLRDVLRNNLPQQVSGDLAERVAARLVDEPIAFAPRARRRWRAVARQAAGLGVAAAIATVAVLNIPMSGRSSPGEEVATADAGTAVASGGPLVSRAARELTGADPWQSRALVVDSRLSGYLVNHNEYAVTSGFQGSLPYMRIVGSPAVPAQEAHENP